MSFFSLANLIIVFIFVQEKNQSKSNKHFNRFDISILTMNFCLVIIIINGSNHHVNQIFFDFDSENQFESILYLQFFGFVCFQNYLLTFSYPSKLCTVNIPFVYFAFFSFLFVFIHPNYIQT